MTNKTEFKSIVVWTIFGFICVLMIRYIEQILVLVSKILGDLFIEDSTICFFIDLIPQFLIIIFWILLFFKYLKGFKNDLKIERFPKKFAIKISLITLCLLFLVMGFKILNNYVWSLNIDSCSPPEIKGIVQIKFDIMAGLNFIEIIVIILGFLRIVRNNAHTANTA